MCALILSRRLEEELAKIKKVGTWVWERGWAERNGGNLSINFTKLSKDILPDFDKCRYVKVEDFPKKLSNKVFFVTGAGKRMRDLNEHLEQNACIIQFDRNVDGYCVLWGGESDENFMPTSELISHMKLHIEFEKAKTGYSAILHSHPTEMICLSHHPVLSKDEKLFNNTIWSMLPEVKLFVPKGVALLPYALPGSQLLAELSVKGLKNHNVALWLKHGALAAGKDLLEAFDYLDVANKGCAIYMKCLASGFKPIGLTKEELNELDETFCR